MLIYCFSHSQILYEAGFIKIQIKISFILEYFFNDENILF